MSNRIEYPLTAESSRGGPKPWAVCDRKGRPILVGCGRKICFDTRAEAQIEVDRRNAKHAEEEAVKAEQAAYAATHATPAQIQYISKLAVLLDREIPDAASMTRREASLTIDALKEEVGF